jgi:hypothetical protein
MPLLRAYWGTPIEQGFLFYVYEGLVQHNDWTSVHTKDIGDSGLSITI